MIIVQTPAHNSRGNSQQRLWHHGLNCRFPDCANLSQCPPPPLNPLWYFKARRGFALIASGRLGNLKTSQCETRERPRRTAFHGQRQTLDPFGGFRVARSSWFPSSPPFCAANEPHAAMCDVLCVFSANAAPFCGVLDVVHERSVQPRC